MWLTKMTPTKMMLMLEFWELYWFAAVELNVGTRVKVVVAVVVILMMRGDDDGDEQDVDDE